MSVLIKMDMPKSCAECQLLEGNKMDGLCHGANKWLDDDFFRWYGYDEEDIDDSKPLNCPLVEVPPHGDLIDRSELLKKERDFGDYEYTAFGVSTENIEDAPTIIQASEEKT